MRGLRSRRAVRGLASALVLLFGSCVFRYPPRVEPIDPNRATRVESPVKAHLLDLSTVFFETGVSLDGDTIHGLGVAIGPSAEPLGPRTSITVDSLAGLEALAGGNVNVGKTVLVNVVAPPATAAAVALLAVAIFGSCPTFYASTADGLTLEAESFSYSVSPLLEGRDVDVLRSTEAGNGWVELELRNEALETHFINHLELLAADTDDGERLVPGLDGAAFAIRELRPLTSAVDASGRDVSGVLRAADGDPYSTPEERIRKAVVGDPYDHIVVEVPPSPDGEATLVLRMRNSLLTTILFYDFMLAPGGIKTVDWMTEDFEKIDEAVELAFWTRKYLGLRIEVEGANGFEPLSRIADTGPIAWEEIGITVPARSDRPTRIRLAFLADAWRIDQVAVAASSRTPELRRVPIGEVVGPDVTLEPEALDALSAPDDQYLETRPTHRMTVRLPVGPEPGAYLLAAQGYYTEWIRPEWIREHPSPTRFKPDEATVRDLHARWLSERSSLEERFFSSAIPVR